MLWETIELRLHKAHSDEMIEMILGIPKQFKEDCQGCRIKLHRNLTIETDWRISICHYGLTTAFLSEPSVIAVKMTALLERFGLVYYSVWESIEGDECF